jgi:hypothetical protein
VSQCTLCVIKIKHWKFSKSKTRSDVIVQLVSKLQSFEIYVCLMWFLSTFYYLKLAMPHIYYAKTPIYLLHNLMKNEYILNTFQKMLNYVPQQSESDDLHHLNNHIC